MSTNEVHSNDAAGNAGVARIDMKLEVVVIPVSDVERSKEFYEGIGWRLDIDRSAGEDFRLVQFTPPGSRCSVHFGKNVKALALLKDADQQRHWSGDGTSARIYRHLSRMRDAMSIRGP